MTSSKSPPLYSRDPTAAVFTSFRRDKAGLSVSRFLAVVGPCAAFCFLVLLVAPWIGSTGVTWRNVLAGVTPDREIFVVARLPRVLFGAVAGGSLAMAGVLFQAILRNSLADPFTLGVSAGSSFGAVLAIWSGLETVVWGIPVVSVAAFGGAFLTILLVFFIARTGNALPTFTLLLSGVTLNFIFGALIMFIHYAANFNQGYLMTRWMMGAVDTADMLSVARSAPFVIACLAGLLWISAQLNLLAAGEDWAATRGVDVRRVKNIAYFIGSILTGAVTAFSGPIGFVGLIVPHTVRLLSGPDHRTLIPASFFLGAAFLVVCDTAGRTLFAPTEIPVGVITALLGGPLFVMLLRRKRGELW
jgi:iron complex transport system permease protein